MPKSRKRKNHKEKLNSRNHQIEESRKAAKKMQQKFLEELIKREQLSGAFDSNKEVGGSSVIEEIQGPEI